AVGPAALVDVEVRHLERDDLAVLLDAVLGAERARRRIAHVVLDRIPAARGELVRESLGAPVPVDHLVGGVDRDQPVRRDAADEELAPMRHAYSSFLPMTVARPNPINTA